MLPVTTISSVGSGESDLSAIVYCEKEKSYINVPVCALCVCWETDSTLIVQGTSTHLMLSLTRSTQMQLSITTTYSGVNRVARSM